MRVIISLIIISFFAELTGRAIETNPPFSKSVKVSLLPVALCWTLTHSAGVSYEFRIKNQFSYGGSVGVIYPSPFIMIHRKTRGFYFSQEIRRYFPERIFFVGLLAESGSLNKESEYQFEEGGSHYPNMIEEKKIYAAPYVTSGFQIPFKKFGFYFEGMLGLGAKFSRSEIAPMTDSEINQLEQDPDWKGMNFNETVAALHFGINLGYRFGK